MRMTTNAVIRKFIRSREDWEPETDRILAIEFYIAPRGDVWTEVHHVVVSHEYSTSTQLEVIRVTVAGSRPTGPSSPEQHVIYAERVFMS